MSPIDACPPAVVIEAESSEAADVALLIATHNPDYYTRPAKRWTTNPKAYKVPRQPSDVECDKAYHRMWGLTWKPQPKFEISSGSSPHPRSLFRHLPTLPAKVKNLRGQLQAWHIREYELSIEQSDA